jgi:hypothetical protein
MYLRESDYWVRREHYKDLLREAERERLAALAVRGAERHPAGLAIQKRLLLSFGRRLSDWGCRLQARYGMIECRELRVERA